MYVITNAMGREVLTNKERLATGVSYVSFWLFDGPARHFFRVKSCSGCYLIVTATSDLPVYEHLFAWL